jgi:ubiquinone/menaquinone biosynthesis C-methylase UbiE
MSWSLDVIQVVLVVLISILLANYLFLRWSMHHKRVSSIDIEEGFANPGGAEGAESSGTEGADTVILGNELLFDDFYAKIYDQIVDGTQRQDVEVNLTLAWAKTIRPELPTIEVLDVGCGTGGQVALFKKAGVGKAIGIDSSDSMIRRGRTLHPDADIRVGDAELIGQFSAAEFNLITLYYFTFYYLKDRGVALKNFFNWLQPGGCLVLHIVNREKFDPILESASPFLAFSVQKYSKERVTRSKVAFDKFDYEAEFDLDGSRGKFKETFQFADGRKRRQTHSLRMPTMAQAVSEVESYGFKYKQFIDLTSIGYEYQYLFCFVR